MCAKFEKSDSPSSTAAHALLATREIIMVAQKRQ